MATLRSTQFANGAITGTSVTSVYTVPSGHKIILKSIQLIEASGVACDVQLRLSGLGTFAVQHLVAYPGSGASVQLKTWMVFEAGQVLQLARSNSGTIGYVLSGSLMTI